ncbi:MAG: VOC family protein [Proteobacteria bacterium]|jgi:catechol 2,3-dioxygenase-like lactoylglutathione lyase family enzyme|nr:VOC family protein [Pseudomonadota bacterium]
MRIHHIGLCCRREEDADRFYRDLLGLEKADGGTVPAPLMRQLFGIDRAIDKRNYAGAGLVFEIFFRDAPEGTGDRIPHVCLDVADPDALADRARAMGFPVLRVPKGEGFVTFIDDANGNRFEIKKG